MGSPESVACVSHLHRNEGLHADNGWPAGEGTDEQGRLESQQFFKHKITQLCS